MIKGIDAQTLDCPSGSKCIADLEGRVRKWHLTWLVTWHWSASTFHRPN